MSARAGASAHARGGTSMVSGRERNRKQRQDEAGTLEGHDKREAQRAYHRAYHRAWSKRKYHEDPQYRERKLAQSLAYYAAHRAELIERMRRRYRADVHVAEKFRARHYGLSAADYNRILARQNGVCGICKRPGRKLCVDHCHATGKVRGLLCHNCNRGLGFYNDNPAFTRAATAYLLRSLGGEPAPLAWIGRGIAVVLLLATWAVACLGLLDPSFPPGPGRVTAAMLELFAGGIGPRFTTFPAALAGPALGIAAGVVLGVIAAAAFRRREHACRRCYADAGCGSGLGVAAARAAAATSKVARQAAGSEGRRLGRRSLAATGANWEECSRDSACVGKIIAIDRRGARASFALRPATPYPDGSDSPPQPPAAPGRPDELLRRNHRPRARPKRVAPLDVQGRGADRQRHPVGAAGRGAGQEGQARLLQPAAVRRALRGGAIEGPVQEQRARRGAGLYPRRQRRHAGADRRRGGLRGDLARRGGHRLCQCRRRCSPLRGHRAAAAVRAGHRAADRRGRSNRSRRWRARPWRCPASATPITR